jgi:hypothetical protein
MATTVGQHGVVAFTNPTNGDALDATIVKSNDNTLREGYVDHDSDPGIHVQSSTTASRPAAGEAGRKWMTYDGTSPRLWYDDGTAWREISYLSTTPGSTTFTGNVTATGAVNTSTISAGGGGFTVNSAGLVTTNTLTVNGPLLIVNPPWYIAARDVLYTLNSPTWTGSVTAQLTSLNFISLTGSATVTLSNPTGYAAMYIAAIKQDAVGGRTLAFTNVLFPGGTTPTQTSTANKTDLWLFTAKDNTTFYGARLAANL